METISIKLPPPLARQVKAEAERTRRSRSEVIREALREKFSASRRGRRPTMAEAMADIEGILEGPIDLASNPKHLEGYGR